MNQLRYWVILAAALIGGVLAANLECKTPKPGERPLRAGDIVIHKLGRRGVITMATPYESGVWNVRLEDGSLEYWTNHEVAYRETD